MLYRANLFRFCRLFGHGDRARAHARLPPAREFQQPYISQSLTEFWRRWHISLTTWIRDYLYMPLGGNRGGEARTYLNLWICFLASGLWHGASWNFVLWGAYNGLFLTLDRIFLRDALQRCGAVIATAVTLFIVMIGWAIFRSSSRRNCCRFWPRCSANDARSGRRSKFPPRCRLHWRRAPSFRYCRQHALSSRLFGAYQRQGWLRALPCGDPGRDLCSGDCACGRSAIPALHLFQVLTMKPLRPFTPGSPAFCGPLVLPLVNGLEPGVAPSYPALAIKIGPKLGGVTYDVPVILSWSSLRDGSFQKAVASRVTDALPIRPLLIRLNNEIRFALFGELTAPHVFRGAKGS